MGEPLASAIRTLSRSYEYCLLLQCIMVPFFLVHIKQCLPAWWCLCTWLGSQTLHCFFLFCFFFVVCYFDVFQSCSPFDVMQKNVARVQQWSCCTWNCSSNIRTDLQGQSGSPQLLSTAGTCFLGWMADKSSRRIRNTPSCRRNHQMADTGFILTPACWECNASPVHHLGCYPAAEMFLVLVLTLGSNTGEMLLQTEA